MVAIASIAWSNHRFCGIDPKLHKEQTQYQVILNWHVIKNTKIVDVDINWFENKVKMVQIQLSYLRVTFFLCYRVH